MNIKKLRDFLKDMQQKNILIYFIENKKDYEFIKSRIEENGYYLDANGYDWRHTKVAHFDLCSYGEFSDINLYYDTANKEITVVKEYKAKNLQKLESILNAVVAH